jgi:hypothetical protein
MINASIINNSIAKPKIFLSPAILTASLVLVPLLSSDRPENYLVPLLNEVNRSRLIIPE